MTKIYDVTVRAKSSPRLMVSDMRVSVRADNPLAAAHNDTVFAEVARVLANDLIAEVEVCPLGGGQKLMVGFVLHTRVRRDG